MRGWKWGIVVVSLMKKSAFFCTVVLGSVCACSGSETGSSGSGGVGTSVGGSLTTGGAGGGLSSAGATAQTGGSSNAAGAMAGGGAPLTGGSNSTGGLLATGGSSTVTVSTGGSEPVGGATSAGGANMTGGAKATGGATAAGATSVTGGTKAGGGTTSAAGATSTGGATSAGGGAVTGGTKAAGGTAATGGTKATGGASATGGAGAGGSSSCAPVTLTSVSASDYQLKVCNVTLDVNPQVGARVTSLKLGSTDIIVPYACTGAYDPNATCNSSGSTFWTSPQSGWDGTAGGSNVWPPLTAIDGAAYAATLSGTVLTLVGTADATLGASVTKAITADASTGWISLTYTIKAQSKQIQAAPWQVTRAPRGGIVFFPLTSLVSNTTSPQWVLSPSGGYEWIDDTNQTSIVSTSGAKILADGGVSGQSYTWLAYALGGNLFLIEYPDIAQSAAATNESDTQVYPGSGYMELEAQGAYATIAANGSSTPWTVQWRVAAIPGSVTVTAGSATLLDFAKQQAAL